MRNRPRSTRIRLWRTLSVRARTTLAATLVVALAISGVSFILLKSLEDSLVGELDRELRTQLDQVSMALREGEPVPASEGPHNVALTVYAETGELVAQSEQQLKPAVPAKPGAAFFTAQPAEPYVQTVPMRSASETVQTPAGERVVRASTSTDAVREATETATMGLLLGGPALLALVGVLTWLVAGRALRPVAAIRDEFTELSARNLHRRVPVPAARDEVSRLARTLNTTLDKLESSMRRQREFVADASHELRSPLSTVRTPLEVALAHPDRADWPTVATEALEDLERLEALTADLLLLARLDANPPSEPGSVELAELIRAQLDRRPPGTVHWNTELTDGVAVPGHRLQLARLLTNLIDNAESHAHDTAALRLRATGSEAILEIVDDGPGIPAEDRERVFERFTRLDEARSRDTGGSGLGLPIAREIATTHGGTLTIEDSARGARFVVRLPLA